MFSLRSPALTFLLESQLTRQKASGWRCRECSARQNHEQIPSNSPRTSPSSAFKSRTSPLPYLLRHCFSTTTRSRLEDHYATLNISPSASQGEIKKAFYTLSKTHHPDRNPKNQEEASKKFVAMSDAYAVLGNPTKRQKYDRERQPASARGVDSHPQGSYSSSQAGGRPASGLSRRRGQFRGPPPSFYRSGGWGTNSEKRRANAAGGGGGGQNQAGESSSGFDESFARQQQGGGAGARGPATEDSADDWPFSAPNDVPHFNRGQHYRRTTAVDEQLRRGRTKRRKILLDEHAEQQAVDQIGAGTEFRSFALISGVILMGVGVPIIFIGRSSNDKASSKGKAT